MRWGVILSACGGGPAPPPLTGVVQVSVGGNHTCALLEGGQVQCWGDPRHGEGSGEPGVPIADIADVVEVEAGSQHTCVRHGDGEVTCWGYNLGGQLGGGPPVPSIPRATELEVGSGKSCVLGPAGELACWGSGFGVSGSESLPPTVFEIGAPVVSVAPAASHTCALTDAGRLYCWGSNDQDEYGDASLPETDTPTEVSAITGLVEVVAGHQHTCGVTGAGEVLCWGYTYASPPVKIEGLPAIVQLSPGQRHSCALASAGSVHCWGANDLGQLGDGTGRASATQAVQVRGVDDAVQISASSDATCALRADTTVVCWGRNADGQLGDGTTQNASSPVVVRADLGES